MHYSKNAFSKNGNPTIEALVSNEKIHSNDLSVLSYLTILTILLFYEISYPLPFRTISIHHPLLHNLQKPGEGDMMGQREGFSYWDLEKIRRMYCEK